MIALSGGNPSARRTGRRRSPRPEGYLHSSVFNILGNALSALGRNAEAASYYRRALSIRLRSTARGDIARIMPMINFAHFLRDTGELEQRLELYEGALGELAAKDWSLPVAIRTREELAGVLLARARPARARYVLLPAVQVILERVASFEEFSASAKAEIYRGTRFFTLQVRLAWELSGRAKPE